MGRGDASLERVRTFVERHRPVLDTPGLALALTDRERTLGVVLDGLANVDAGTPVGPEHRFQIGSISKGFTVMALLQEREGGRLDLNAPVTEYLPWFEVRSAFGPITVHHLLSHTAGIVCGMDSTGEAAHEVWSLRETHTGWAPGERFLYSNVGYKALGLVLEAVAGRPWWKVVRERVTEPIGIGDVDVVITNAARHRLAVGYTSPFDDRPWQPRHAWAPSAWFESATADGTICATADELAAYARLLLNRGEGVLSEGSFALMTRPVAGDPDAPGEMFGYGLKWVPQDGGRLLGHSGGMIGFTAYLLVEPEAGIGVTVLMNSAFGRRLDLARFALACLGAEAGGAPLPDVPEPPDRASVPDASTFAGLFVDELGSANVLAEGDRLFLDEGDGRRAALLPIAEGRFAVNDPERDRHVLEVVRMDGAPVGVHWGPRSLRPPGAHATAGEVPAEWRALAGRYRSWNPWAPGFEVFARGDGLRLELLGDAVDLEGSQPLVPDADGSFVVGERPSPSRIRFDTPIDGRPTRAIFDAASFYRTAGP